MEKQSIGRNIRKLRRSLDMSQAELAESIGCTRQTITNWERGATTPSQYGIARIAKSLGVEAWELLKED